jgi:hypothetical protein
MKASDTMAEFHRRRQPASIAEEDREPTWTVALEIERGAFPPDLPGEPEKHWSESLERARLDESAGRRGKAPADFLKPSEPVLAAGRRGATSAAPKRKPAKRPARKKAAKKKAAKKRPARKAAKRKATQRQRQRRATKRRGARKSAKRKS